jgi:ABC-type branched-subunit amino acid transport system permease subunit
MASAVDRPAVEKLRQLRDAPIVRRALGVFAGGRGNWRGSVTGLAFLGIVGMLVVNSRDMSHATVNYFAIAVVYTIVAVSISFLYSLGGVLSVVHGSLWGIGAYIAAILCQNHGWGFVPAALVAIFGVAIIAALFAGLSVRLRGSYFVIVLFAASEVIEGVMINWTSLTGGNGGIVMSVNASIGGHAIDDNLSWYRVGLITLLVVLAILQFTAVSRLGRQLRAIRDNRDLAISVGISVGKVHTYAFALSGAMAGLAGVYWAFLQAYVVPSQYSVTAGISFLVIMLIGGAAYMLGPAVGALIVIFLPSILHLSPLLSNAVIGVAFIVVILSSPQGVAGMLVNVFRKMIGPARGRAATTEENAEIQPNVDISSPTVGAS